MSLKLGDEVVVHGIYGRNRILGVIVRETKTQYIVATVDPLNGNRHARELRFNRTTFRRVGEATWSTSFTLHGLKPGDREAIAEESQKRILSREIDGVVWSILPVSALLEIKAITERYVA